MRTFSADPYYRQVKKAELRQDALRMYLACSLVTIGMYTVLLYLDFTPVGLDVIRGVQSRYMLPLVYPVLMFVGPGRWGVRGRGLVSNSLYNGIVLGACATILLASWWTSYLSVMV